MEDARGLLRQVVDGYARVDLLTYANAIAFQVLFALVPLGLFALGAAGFLGLEGLYADDLRPELEKAASANVFAVLDDTFGRVLSSGQTFWVTAGALFAVWKLSGAMRAVMGAFERIYDDADDRRGLIARYRLSILLAVAAAALLIGAFAATRFLPAPAGWPLALLLMVATVGLIVHFVPADRPPWRFVSFGSGIVVVAWAGTSVVFGLYVTEFADYGSIFGNLATIVILFEYLYLAAVAFLTGALLDSLVRAEGR